jgi:hypothetical protein
MTMYLVLYGGSTTAIIKATTTIAQAYEVNLPVELLWVGSKFKLEMSPREVLRKLNSLQLHFKDSSTPKL